MWGWVGVPGAVGMVQGAVGAVVCNKSKSLFVLLLRWFNCGVGWLFCTVAGCVLVWLCRGWWAGGDDGGAYTPLRGMASELI